MVLIDKKLIDTYVQMYCIKLKKCLISRKPQIKKSVKSMDSINKIKPFSITKR